MVIRDLWDSWEISNVSLSCSYCEDYSYEMSESLKDYIASHLHPFKNEFSRYFPEIVISVLVRNPFKANIDDCVPII